LRILTDCNASKIAAEDGAIDVQHEEDKSTTKLLVANLLESWQRNRALHNKLQRLFVFLFLKETLGNSFV